VIKQEEFVDAGYPGNRAWQLAPAFFFPGALLVWLLDKAVHNLHASPRDFAAADFRNRIIQSLSSSAQKKNAQSFARREWRSDEDEENPSHSDQDNNARDENKEGSDEDEKNPSHSDQDNNARDENKEGSDEDEKNPSHSDQDNNARDENKEGSDERLEEGSYHTSQSEQAAANGLANQKASLGKLGILTALSIALHNLPEGAAVYIRWVYLCVNSYLEMHTYLHPVAQHLSLVLAVQLLAHPLALQ
jgi:zinc transporter ZupT